MDAWTQSAISSRSQCAIAATIVKNKRPDGVLVSMLSCKEIMSALRARKYSAKSFRSRLLRDSRDSLEKMSLVSLVRLFKLGA